MSSFWTYESEKSVQCVILQQKQIRTESLETYYQGRNEIKKESVEPRAWTP